MLEKKIKFITSILQPFPPFKVSMLQERGNLDKRTSILVVDANDMSRVQLLNAIRNTSLFSIQTAASTQESNDLIKDADILVYHWHKNSQWTEANQIISSWRRAHDGPICVLTPFLDSNIRQSFYVSGVSNVIETETPTLAKAQAEDTLFDIETVLAVLHNYERTEAFRRMITEYSKREEYLLEYLELATQEIARLKRYVPLSIGALALLLFLQLTGQEIPWEGLFELLGR